LALVADRQGEPSEAMTIDSISTVVTVAPTAPRQTADKAIYTCPMHPEVQQDHPGDCPKCGMALEPKVGAASMDDEESGELRNMTRRFWISAFLALPVFVLAMAHLIPALGAHSWVESDASRWTQFALAIPVVGWAGLFSTVAGGLF
jgi:Cu+-exporting ATPase